MLDNPVKKEYTKYRKKEREEMLMREYIITIIGRTETEKTEYRIIATEGWKAEKVAMAQHHGYITRMETKRA